MTEIQKSLMERRVETLERIANIIESNVGTDMIHIDEKLARIATALEVIGARVGCQNIQHHYDNPFLKEATSLSGWEMPAGESWQIGDHVFDEGREEE